MTNSIERDNSQNNHISFSDASKVLVIPFIGAETSNKPFLKPSQDNQNSSSAFDPYMGIYTSLGSDNLEFGTIFDTSIPPKGWQETFFIRVKYH